MGESWLALRNLPLTAFDLGLAAFDLGSTVSTLRLTVSNLRLTVSDLVASGAGYGVLLARNGRPAPIHLRANREGFGVRLLELKTILVATDLDEGSRPALATARELAESAGAEVHVVHVSADPDALETLAAKLADLGLEPEYTSLHVATGEASHAINVLADTIGVDAILIGPHRGRHRAEGRAVLGSTALALATNAATPCLVATSVLRIPLQRTLVAVDISDSARGTLAVALSWTSALRTRGRDAAQSTRLTALHVARSRGQREQPPASNDELGRMIDRLRDDAGSWAGTPIESVSTENPDAAAGISDYANTHRADLVVLGTRGLGVDSVGRIGSVAASVMKRLDIPVLLVPPAVWAESAPQSPRH